MPFASSSARAVGTTVGGCQARVVTCDATGTRIRDRDPATHIDRYFADDFFILDVDVPTDTDTGAELR